MCNATINKCKTCHLREATEVTGDDADIKREFERIERACQHKQGWELKYKADAQTKTPPVGAVGV